MDQLVKHCSQCSKDKDLDAFGVDRSRKDGYSCYCKQCNNQRASKRYHEDEDYRAKRNSPARLEYRRNWNRKKNFGLTTDEYMNMLLSQNGVCAICNGVNSDRSLAVDHDHKTEAIRGLLCTRCNNAIGAFKDDPELLRKAARYLERSD